MFANFGGISYFATAEKSGPALLQMPANGPNLRFAGFLCYLGILTCGSIENGLKLNFGLFLKNWKTGLDS